MPIDYSRWDNLELSDSDDDRKPKVIKLDPSQRVELGRDGYNIISSGTNATNPRDFAALSIFWKKHVENGGVVGRSHVFSQNRYEICVLIAVSAEDKHRFEVAVTESTLRILRSGIEILNKDFYTKVKDDDEFMNWKIVRQEIDWKALESYCRTSGPEGHDANISFTEFYEQTFIELELTKHSIIEDCVIWWPKVFKVSLKALTSFMNLSDFMCDM
ncbi:uncharacterized protein BXIN_2171 [Babesia sp. Xinjiang]|uniref:uncharacterized protein n=1 Tax=Babesia sp. Xinjiang TaxID=462227 RepID=UPI000A223895|nr:uncharacterized protein BXIN_2171 [Babesia sp. Xinjiang]ORM40416.1 hypothetical protein BXIN_2171 [Babesia sp. Xinjiang]